MAIFLIFSGKMADRMDGCLIAQVIVVLFLTLPNPSHAQYAIKDICNSKAVVAHLDTFYTTRNEKMTLNLDVTNFVDYVKAFTKGAKGFNVEAAKYDTKEELEAITDNRLLEFTSEIALYKIDTLPMEAMANCKNESGYLLNLDYPENDGPLKAFMIKNGIDKTIVDLHVDGRSNTVSRNGRYLSKLEATWAENKDRPSAVDYFQIDKDGVITPNGGTTTSPVKVTALCMVPKAIYSGKAERSFKLKENWLAKIKEMTEALDRILEIYGRLGKALGELPKVESLDSGIRTIMVYAPIRLIELVEFLNKHSSNEGFRKFKEEDYFKMGRLLKYAMEIAKMKGTSLLRPEKMSIEKARPLVTYETIFGRENNVIYSSPLIFKKRKEAEKDSKQELTLEVEIEYEEINFDNKIEIQKVQPYFKDSNSPKSGYIVTNNRDKMFKAKIETERNCGILNEYKYCRGIEPIRFKEEETECAKYLLEIGGQNSCPKNDYDGPSVIRTNCHDIETVISSYPEEYALEKICNLNEVSVINLEPGISSIQTQCKLKYKAELKVTQEKNLVDSSIKINKLELDKEFKRMSLDKWVIIAMAMGIPLALGFIALNVMLTMKILCPNCWNKSCKCKCCMNNRDEPENDSEIDSPLALPLTYETGSGSSRYTSSRIPEYEIETRPVFGPREVKRHSYRRPGSSGSNQTYRETRAPSIKSNRSNRF